MQELGRSDLAAVRNNIMIIMTDFCVRYTALIDGYLRNLSSVLLHSKLSRCHHVCIRDTGHMGNVGGDMQLWIQYSVQ